MPRPINNLRVWMPTAITHWMPSTAIVEKVIQSIWGMLGRVPIHIYCDYPAPWATEEDVVNYTEYCNRLTKLHAGPVVMSWEWIGLVGQFKRFISECDKPVVFYASHDHEFLDSYRIHIIQLLSWLLREDINYVGFLTVDLNPLEINRIAKYGGPEWYRSKGSVPLIPSTGWGDCPVIASLKHYKEQVLPRVSSNWQLRGGSYGLEGPLTGAYRRQIKEQGFVRAHSEWKTYIYGNPGDKAYVRNLGHGAREWRDKRMAEYTNVLNK